MRISNICNLGKIPGAAKKDHSRGLWRLSKYSLKYQYYIPMLYKQLKFDLPKTSANMAYCVINLLLLSLIYTSSRGYRHMFWYESIIVVNKNIYCVNNKLAMFLLSMKNKILISLTENNNKRCWVLNPIQDFELGAPVLRGQMLLTWMSGIYEFFKSIALFIKSMETSWLLVTKLGGCVTLGHHLRHKQ